MTPESLFHTLLGLGTQWRVTHCEFVVEESTVRLWIEETALLWNGESINAKAAVTAYDHTEELVWRHLNVFEHRCEIHCRLPHGKRTTTGQPGLLAGVFRPRKGGQHDGCSLIDLVGQNPEIKRKIVTATDGLKPNLTRVAVFHVWAPSALQPLGREALQPTTLSR